MIAIRLPTGELEGRHASESGRITRIRSGSICRTSPITVETSVSCPCPDEVLWIVTVTKPRPSMLMRQETIHVVVVFFSLCNRSNHQPPPPRPPQGGVTLAGHQPNAATL